MIIDNKLLEMAKVYRMPTERIIKYIYIPEIISFIKGKFSKK